MKLAKELARRSTGQTLYLLDEPTTGLHFVDVEQLLGLIDRLVDRERAARESGREVRVSRKQDVYYQLTVEVTDLETSLIAARTQKDRLRRASKPLIGW